MKDKRTADFWEMLFITMRGSKYVNLACAWSFFRHDTIMMVVCWISAILTGVSVFLAAVGVISFNLAISAGTAFGLLCFAAIFFRAAYLSSLDKHYPIRNELREIMERFIDYKIKDQKIGLTTEETKEFLRLIEKIKKYFRELRKLKREKKNNNFINTGQFLTVALF